MHKSSITAAFNRLNYNSYSRDEMGRIKHSADLDLIRRAFNAAPRDARRYAFLRERLLVTDIVKVKDNTPSTDKTYGAEIDALIDQYTKPVKFSK